MPLKLCSTLETSSCGDIVFIDKHIAFPSFILPREFRYCYMKHIHTYRFLHNLKQIKIKHRVDHIICSEIECMRMYAACFLFPLLYVPMWKLVIGIFFFIQKAMQRFRENTIRLLLSTDLNSIFHNIHFLQVLLGAIASFSIHSTWFFSHFVPPNNWQWGWFDFNMNHLFV